MRRIYDVAFFIDRKGNNFVQDYLLSLNNQKDLTALINVIQRLSYIGQYLLDTNMAKRIDGPIYELRKGRHRILYAKFNDRFILLSAFMKKTKKTPNSEIRLARKRHAEYKKTDKCLIIKIPNT
jgi:phage-related protein